MTREFPAVMALHTLWQTLPQTMKSEWATTYWTLIDLLRQFEAATDEEEKARLHLKLRRLVRRLPGGQEALRAAGESRRAPASGARGEYDATYSANAGDGSTIVQGSANVFATNAPLTDTALTELLHPEPVTRYADIFAPPRVQVGKRFPVIVGLTRAAPADNDEPTALQARLNQLIRVVLTPVDDGLEPLSEPAKTIRITKGDSDPAVFYFRATRNGTKNITIDFWSEGNFLTGVTHTLIAAADGTLSPGQKQAFEMILSYPVPYPDTVLRVTTVNNQLNYTIHARDTTERIIRGPSLKIDPENFRYRLIRRIENLTRGKDANGNPLTDSPDDQFTPEQFRREFEKIGQWLYLDLFNEPMRQEYRRLREKTRTLEIVSDEPWIPWELVKPYDHATGIDDDFLCMQFDFSRWVSGSNAPAPEIRVDGLACIAPTDSGLAAAQQEKTTMSALSQTFHLADHSPAEALKSNVEALLEGDTPIRLWHFACHGNFDNNAPADSPLILQNGRYLKPTDLVGKTQRRLHEDRPLVFLNACRVGQAGLTLTGLGGWAKTLVSDCRVGALIAPLWSVNDAAARFFAEAFYRLAQKPEFTLGAALRKARRETKNNFPDDPTYLAYSLYAHPNAKLRFDGK